MISELTPILRRAALILALGLGVTACAATFQNHGYVPPADDLAEIQIGTTRDAVAEAVGRPAAGGVIRDEAWFYTAYRVRNFAYRAPEVIEREIVAISFDANGRVSDIETFGLEDGNIVPLSRRVTDTTVARPGFFRQILSNFGRINLEDVVGE